MTDLPTYAEMRAHSERCRAWDVRRKERGAQDGFLIEQWTEDGDVFGCMGHVDREAFIAQWRWVYTDMGDQGALDDVTVAQVEHRYAFPDISEDGVLVVRWEMRVRLPLGRVRTRAVTADDPGAEPVTMLDL